MKRQWVLIISTLVIVGCVAGAAKDDSWVREGAHNYKGYTSPSLQAFRIHEKAKNRYSVEELFQQYKHTITIDQDGHGEIEENRITFIKQKLTITNQNGSYAVQLPEAFYFSPLRGCNTIINGKNMLVFVVRTRASTARRFVGIIDLHKMEHVFLHSLPSGDVSEIIIENDIVKILGWENGIQINFK